MRKSTAPPTEHELEGIGQHIENFAERFAQPRRPLEIFKLPGWDTATQDERDGMVEKWLIEQLKDPQFIELCSTMERNWQRIGIP